mgnify:CR=1 FL=1
MAASLIGGLLADGHDPAALQVMEPDPERRQWLGSHFGISCNEPSAEQPAQCDILVLAVKPQLMASVAAQWSDFVQSREPVVVSIAAGIRTGDLARWLGGYPVIVRAMPNTPALIQAGATGLYACDAVNADGRAGAEAVLRAAGLTLWVDDEELLDSITAISGSGPAYFFLFMEALQHAGVSLGLEEKSARLLTLQTALGAARMALESNSDLAELRRQVTSPGGTTEQAIRQFTDDDLSAVVQRAAKAAARRAKELADQLGSDEPGSA